MTSGGGPSAKCPACKEWVDVLYGGVLCNHHVFDEHGCTKGDFCLGSGKKIYGPTPWRPPEPAPTTMPASSISSLSPETIEAIATRVVELLIRHEAQKPLTKTTP